MRYMVEGGLDARTEARVVLERLVTQSAEDLMWSDMTLACTEYGKKMRCTDAEYEALLRPLETVYARVLDALPPPDAEEREFFRLIQGAQGSLSEAMELMQRCGSEFPDQTAVRAARMQVLLELLQADFADAETPRAETLEQFAAHLEKMELTDAEKYRCIRLCLDFDAQYARMDAVLSQAERLIGREEGVLEPLLERWRAVYEPMTDAAFYEKLANLGLRFDGEECLVRPCLMRFAAITVREVELSADRMHLYIGGLFDEALERLNAAENSVRMLAGDLKAMGDPNRMEILRALSGGEKYAQELTALLGLTSATVSHHMSELIGRELVTAEKRGTRLYYALRRDKLERIAQALREF